MPKRHDPKAHAELTHYFEPNSGSLQPMHWNPSDQVYADPELLDAFLEQVLEIRFAMVTDKTCLSDFLGVLNHDDIADIRERVLAHFGVDIGLDFSWCLTDLLVDIRRKMLDAQS